MMDRATSIFVTALNDLEARMGVRRDALTPEDVVALVRASERAASPFREVNADAVGLPVRVCDGVYFWRLTVGASVWLDEIERMFPERNDGRYRQCLIHAVVHAREPEAFARIDERSVLRAARSTCRGICATPAEIEAAMDEVLGIVARRPSPSEDLERSATDWRSICVRLEARTGISAHDWVWKHSARYVLACYNDLDLFARVCDGHAPGHHMRDELDEAMEALQLVKVGIMRRLAKEGGANG